MEHKLFLVFMFIYSSSSIVFASNPIKSGNNVDEIHKTKYKNIDPLRAALIEAAREEREEEKRKKLERQKKIAERLAQYKATAVSLSQVSHETEGLPNDEYLERQKRALEYLANMPK